MIKLSVKAARVNAGLKSKDVAKLLGLSHTGYSDKENGKKRFYADEAFKLSKLFGVPYTIFFNPECPKLDTENSGGNHLDSKNSVESGGLYESQSREVAQSRD